MAPNSTDETTLAPLLPEWLQSLQEYQALPLTGRLDVIIAEGLNRLDELTARLTENLYWNVTEAAQVLAWTYQEAVWRLNEREAQLHKDYLAYFWQPLPEPYGYRRNATNYLDRGLRERMDKPGTPHKLFPTFYMLTVPLEHRGLLF